MFRSAFTGVATLALWSCCASAQTYLDRNGTNVPAVVPLVGCATNAGCSGPVSSSNPLPVSGSFSATVSGFAPGGAYAGPMSVSTTSARTALPAGAVAVIYNTGTVPAYLALGGSNVTATTANDVVSPGSWIAFSVGSNSYLAALTASGATSLNISGGSGLAAGNGGGGALPIGAATAANQTAVQSAPGASASTALTIQGSASGVATPVTDSQSAAFAGAVAMTVGTTYGAQRSVGVLATAAGNVVFQFPDASTLTLPVTAGWQSFPFACTQIVSSGTTATATYFNLK